jgi:hypothetical protein
LKLVDRIWLLRWVNGGSYDTALLPLLLLKIRSVRMLESAGSDRMFRAISLAVLSCLGRRFTPSGRWIHLPSDLSWSFTLPI